MKLDEQIEILDWHHANSKNQTQIAKHFAPKYLNLQLKQPLILKWVKEKAKWQEEWSHSEAQTAKRT